MTPNIDKAIALGRIELKPRHRPKNVSWNPGGVIRGDREIWIDGAHWLNATMEQRGCHGARHVLSYADGGELLEDSNSRRPHPITLQSYKTRRRNAKNGEVVAVQYDALRELVLSLLNAGKLEDPATRKQRREDASARYREQRDAENAERDRMLEGVFSLRDRTDLTRAERDGLAWLYKEAFAGNAIPFPEGKPA